MMDANPEAMAGFQFGPAMMSTLRRAASLPARMPGMSAIQQQVARRRHHGPPPPRHHGRGGWGGQQLRGRPGVRGGVDCDAAGMPMFLTNFFSKVKAVKANRRAKQYIAKEDMCRKLLASRTPPPMALGLGWGTVKNAAGAVNRASKDRFGRLLISAVPYGATALQARDLRLQILGQLARAGDDEALTKIAIIRAKAGRGDAAAEKALDTIKVAQVIQTGGRTRPGGGYGGGGGGHYHRAGLANLMRRNA